MLDYLVRHAVDNVWCSPEQDLQAIIKPHRISRGNNHRGSLDYHQVLWDRTPLPSHNEEYHIFQIGHIHPKLLGLVPVNESWTRLTDVINSTQLMSDIYFKDGRQVPRHLCWIRFGRRRNLVIAIQDNSRFHRLRKDDIFIRFYTNAFFNSDRSDASIDDTRCYGKVAGSQSAIVDFQRKYHDYVQKKGSVFAYCNGILVNDLSPSNVRTGDSMEFVYDSSIYRTIDFKVKDLKTFVSTLDDKRKYLLNYPAFNNDTIDFKDDIDVYLIKRKSNGSYKGTYYHQNQPSAVRMLTHKDYSVPVSFIQGYVDDNSDLYDDLNDVVIRFYIREAGYKRPLIFESNRIFELYQMSPEKVARAMLGIDSTIDEWRAENLENSPYVSLMGYRYPELSKLLVQKAYGYNAIAKYLGDSPVRTRLDNGQLVADVPIAYQLESTAYEYDQDGLLLGYYQHTNHVLYFCNHSNVKYVEFIGGLVSDELDFTFNQTEVELNPKYNHRVYLCTSISDNPRWDWDDISRSEIVEPTESGVRINTNPYMDYPATLSDKYFLGYTLELAPKNGVLKFSVSGYETHFDERKRRVSTIPPRRVDVWLNGKSLIHNLDYVVKWPEIVISTIEHHDFSLEKQRIDIRATGFSKEDLSMDDQMDYGFVVHGHLSKNGRYDIRDDKVHSIIVGGGLRNFDETVSFAEHKLEVNDGGVENGTPYSIKENIVPLRDQMYIDTYQFRDESLDIDRRVSDYMSLHYPEPTIDKISPIRKRYELHSPFLSRIIYDMKFGLFTDEQLKVHYSNSEINEWLKDYKYLLDFDPAWIGVDERYVTVYPHRYNETIELNVYQFNFLKRVIQFYFNGKVEANHFVKVTIPNI